jgi:hypothetical protein
MQQALIVAALLALLGGWTLFLHKRSGGRIWSPLWVAFSLALAALLYFTGVSRL